MSEPFLRSRHTWASLEFRLSDEHDGIEVLATFMSDAHAQAFCDISKRELFMTRAPRCTLYDGNGFETQFTLLDEEVIACRRACSARL